MIYIILVHTFLYLLYMYYVLFMYYTIYKMIFIILSFRKFQQWPRNWLVLIKYNRFHLLLGNSFFKMEFSKKKVMAQPGMVERFFPDPNDADKVAAIRATFAGLWYMDDEETNAVIQVAYHYYKYYIKYWRKFVLTKILFLYLVQFSYSFG